MTDDEKNKVDGALNDIRSYRERAISMVKDIKSSESASGKIDQARSLYDNAKTVNKTWIVSLATHVKDGTNLDRSEFKTQGEKANETVKAFVRFAENLLNPKENQTVSQYSGYNIVDIAEILRWLEFIKDLLEIGITIWTVYSKESQEKRIFLSKNIEKEVWPEWDEIKK